MQLAGLLDDTRLLAVRQELSKLHRTFKETDLFKLYQTGDLGNLDPSDPTHAAALPQTLALRDALYSDAFRAFVRHVTGHAAWGTVPSWWCHSSLAWPPGADSPWP